MDQIGKYKNEIKDLTSLDVKDYERIFKVYQISENDKDFYYYNINHKIDFPLIDEKYLGYYDVKSNSPLTKISYDIYGDIKSWWIVYGLNKDLFDDIPFVVRGGLTLKYILKDYRSQIYRDITQNTVFSGRHF